MDSYPKGERPTLLFLMKGLIQEFPPEGDANIHLCSWVPPNAPLPNLPVQILFFIFQINNEKNYFPGECFEVFAPTDEAFKKLPPAVMENKTRLAEIFKFHIVEVNCSYLNLKNT